VYFTSSGAPSSSSSLNGEDPLPGLNPVSLLQVRGLCSKPVVAAGSELCSTLVTVAGTEQCAVFQCLCAVSFSCSCKHSFHRKPDLAVCHGLSECLNPSLCAISLSMLLQALAFTGDLSAGDIQPQHHASPLTPEQQLRLARRKSALLSMPIACPPAAASGRNSSSSSSSSSGGLFGWMDAATQPWTPTGRPDPEPLNPKQVGIWCIWCMQKC
jgi:hypothetical protein